MKPCPSQLTNNSKVLRSACENNESTFSCKNQKVVAGGSSEKVVRGMKLKVNMAVRFTLISYFSGNRTP
jgi:hypothetical protein